MVRQDHPLARGLSGYWLFDKTFHDFAGSTPAVPENNPQWTRNALGNALKKNTGGGVLKKQGG